MMLPGDGAKTRALRRGRQAVVALLLTAGLISFGYRKPWESVGGGTALRLRPMRPEYSAY